MFFFSGQSYRKVAVLLENVACSSAEHDYCLKDKRAFEVHWKVIYLLWLLDLKIRGRRRRKRRLKSEFSFMQSALLGGHVGLRYCGIEYFSSLRKHPFLLALRRCRRFARRNVCDSATEIPY